MSHEKDRGLSATNSCMIAQSSVLCMHISSERGARCLCVNLM